MGGAQYLDVGGYSALILRRTLPELEMEGGLISRAHEWWAGTAAVWSEQKKRWQFPCTGGGHSTIQFGYLQYEKDKYHYQGSEFQYIGFDELTAFTRTQYLYLMSRLRRLEGFPVPLRIRSASNPGNTGHIWVKERLVDPGHKSRPYIRALLSDNKHLDQAAYERTLRQLDPITRLHLLNGDWSARESGDMFRREWLDGDHIVDGKAPKGATRCRFWDLAATQPTKGRDPDYTAGVLIAQKDGQYWIEHVIRFRETPARTELLIARTAKVDGSGVMVRMEQEPGASGKITISHYARHILQGSDFKGVPHHKEKLSRMRPLASAAEQGNVFLTRSTWNEAFLDEAEAIPHGSHVDQVDAAAGALEEVAGGGFLFV